MSGVAFNEVMTFVDNEYQVFAMFNQNELHQVVPGNEAEITLDTYPGQIIKAHVDSVIWAQAQGQIEASGDLPRTTFTSPPGKFPVKLVVAEHDNALFLAAGARGAAAIYTEHVPLLHLIRKVLITDVVVSRLHHHQAQYQSPLKDGTMARLRSNARPPLRSIAALVATGLVATMAGCAVKKPPDAAAIKEQALPGLQTPAQWTAAGAGAGTVSDNWVASFHDDQLAAAVTEAIAHNADLRVGAARVELALLNAKLAGAKLYPSVDVLAHGGTKHGGRLGPPGHCDLRDLGDRPLGPRALRPGGKRRPGRVGAGGFRVRATVDCGTRSQELVPCDRGRAAGRGGTRDDSCER